MEEFMRREEMGLNKVPEKYLCKKHINDNTIFNYIRRNASPGYCDYCKKEIAVVPLEDVLEFAMEGVASFYTNPANFMSYNGREGGYQGNVYSSSEILQEHFELDITDNTLFDDFYDSLDPFKHWADEMEYYDSPSDILRYSWGYFKELVKHKTRYFFGLSQPDSDRRELIAASDMLREIGQSVAKFRLKVTLPAGTAFYRCRQHAFSDSSVRTAEGMTSPPIDKAFTANRMSPAGVSMFYGAFERETAVKETVDYTDKKKSYHTSVMFTLKKELNVIDLTRIPPLPSPFDQRKRKDYYIISFVNSFVRDFVSPIARDGKEHIGYVPTQIVTEFFRYPFSNRKRGQIDGIIYPSSKDGKKACVLFYDNDESLDVLEFRDKSLKKVRI